MPLNLIFIQPGTYTIDDNGTPGDNISVIRDSNGVVIFTFGHPADALGFTVSTPGVNIIVNFTDSMNAANFTIGSLTDLAQSPESIVMKNIVTTGTVSLVANTTIREGGADAASDITAGAVILSAVGGVGTTGNAIETRTGLFEAETTTGGINIRNIGSVQIGGLTADVDGLDVVTSGNINFVTVGSIFLTEANSATAGEVVHGGSTSGNVTLVASGVNSDIIGNVDNGAVTVPRGFLTMTAGRDIQLGTIGSDFNNDVVTNNTLTFTAGRDILIDGFADILADNFGLDTGGNLVFTAGRNIGILNVAGVSASVTASGSGGGDAILTTGFGGSLTVNGPGAFALGSTSGDVTVNADRVLIDAGSGISAPSGEVVIRPRTDGRGILLGSVGDAAFALELSDLELNRIFAPSLTIGSTAAGLVRVIAPIAPISGGNAPDLIIRSGTEIRVESNITVLDDITLLSGNNLFQWATSVITAGGSFDAFVDEPAVDGGIGTLSGSITATPIKLTGNLNADTLTGTGGNDQLFGLGGADTLRGNGGADTLNGGTGVDRTEGGLGDDVHIVDNGADLAVEAVGEGFDTVQSSVTYTLGANIEKLVLTGATAINGTGNTLDNIIVGNGAANILNGGAGADEMKGEGGDDTYVVDNVADLVLELSAAGGVDLVQSSVTFTLGGNVENLTLTGGGSINGTGNGIANTLTGNGGVNVLNGAGGADILLGGGGADSLLGGVGVDDLFGGGGNDDLNGGSGADGFRFDTALSAASNVDDILDFSVADDTIFLDRDIFTGIGVNGTLAAGAFRAGTVAVDADDRILYDSATGQILYDADGVGGVAAILFATVTPGTALTNADFSAYI